MTLVEVRDLVKHYAGERSWFGLGRAHSPVRAVDGVSFTIAAGVPRVGGRVRIGEDHRRAYDAALQEPTAARCCSRTTTCSRSTPRGCARCAAACRSSSRIRTARSTAHDRRGNAARAAADTWPAREVSALLDEVGLDAAFANRYRTSCPGATPARRHCARPVGRAAVRGVR